MSLRVRNRATGLVHDVPAGHPALNDGQHDVLPEATKDTGTPAGGKGGGAPPARRRKRTKSS